MFTPSNEIILLIQNFAPAMSASSFKNALILIYGSILAPGKRTVTSALKAAGLTDPNFHKFHRVLSRNTWSAQEMSMILLGLLIQAFIPKAGNITLVADETLERRQGKRIRIKGWYKDPIRSNGGKIVTSQGIRWLSVMLLVKTKWSSREWALPFFTVPTLSEKVCNKVNKTHRTSAWWVVYILEKISKRFPERKITLVGDGGFAVVGLVAGCQRLKVNLISRFRPDGCLYDLPGEQPSNKRGPKPKKGARQMKLEDRLKDPATQWTKAIVPWYAGNEKEVFYATGVSLWYTPGQLPVPIRWFLVKYEETDVRTGSKKWKSSCFFCSETEEPVSVFEVIGGYTSRWNIEVTFEELRAHLGFETQRQWSSRSLERTTPCLFGLFSLVVLMAHVLHPDKLPIESSSWYEKEEATFSDALGSVRSHLWSNMNYMKSSKLDDMRLIPCEIWNQMVKQVCYTR